MLHLARLSLGLFVLFVSPTFATPISSCSGVTLLPDYPGDPTGYTPVQAVCDGTNNEATTSVLDLDACLTNNNGVMSCSVNGGIGYSCHECTLAGTTITCSCENGDGSGYPTSSVDLSGCVGFTTGALQCFATTGSVVSVAPTMRARQRRRSFVERTNAEHNDVW